MVYACSWGTGSGSFGVISTLLLIGLLILVILGIIKLWKDITRKKR